MKDSDVDLRDGVAKLLQSDNTTLRRFLHRFGMAGLGAFDRLHDLYRRAFRAATTLGYLIMALLTDPIMRRLSTLRNRRVSGTVAAAEFHYQPLGWPGARRFVAIRRPVPEEPSWWLHLFQLGRFNSHVFVTTLSLTPLYLWRFYNERSQAQLILRRAPRRSWRRAHA